MSCAISRALVLTHIRHFRDKNLTPVKVILINYEIPQFFTEELSSTRITQYLVLCALRTKLNLAKSFFEVRFEMYLKWDRVFPDKESQTYNSALVGSGVDRKATIICIVLGLIGALLFLLIR